MVSREIYSTGLKKKVMCEVHDIIATKTKGGGSRYQVIGYYNNPETGKEHKCQSLIGAQDAATICEQLGKTLPVYAAEEATPSAFAAEASEPSDSGAELLVPEPSTDPVGDGRIIGQHTGGEIVSATDAAPSLPAHDYVWAGRAEEDNYNKGNDGTPEAYNTYMRGSALSRLKRAINSNSPEEVAIPMEEGLRDEEMEAEFSEVTESVQNVYEDSDGREVFVVDEPIKNYLSDVMDDDIRNGLVVISKSTNGEFEVAFPYSFSEDVVDAIAEFQTRVDEEGYDGYYDREDFPEMIMDAQSMVDSMEEGSTESRFNKQTAAVIAASLAIGAAWWFSRKA
ncbi:hypothetical protein N9M17_00430 [bacterium]|jgi:hypothetical protein|nr:hypothetical protein [bacterium]MDB4741120.1 hypothetical protein [Akkermansiaceae bacterium]